MNAGSGSGILRLRREIPLLFGTARDFCGLDFCSFGLPSSVKPALNQRLASQPADLGFPVKFFQKMGGNIDIKPNSFQTWASCTFPVQVLIDFFRTRIGKFIEFLGANRFVGTNALFHNFVLF